VPADELPTERSAPMGFPPGFGRGDGEADAILTLSCLRGITPRQLRDLAWDRGSARACVTAIASGRVGSDNDRAYVADLDLPSIRRDLDACGARLALPGDPEYWPAFLRLEDPPVGVFLRGQPLGMGDERVAVIGSRRPSALGREVAIDLARGLARAGVPVVSGGAVGIDAAAHQGALDAGGRTVAVLGSGIDLLYPPSNRRLLAEVERTGTIVSEYAPGVPAEPRRFPARNRIIASLSRGLVVVEGAAKSGTRITAEHAMEVGVEVFAVPGPVTSPLAETPLELIREGATLIRGVDDLLHDLELDIRTTTRGQGPVGLPEDESRAFDALEMTMLPDAVARKAGLTIPEAVAALIHLELRGLVRGVGGRYERTFAGAPGGAKGPKQRRAG
jgi:DNA processing protein